MTEFLPEPHIMCHETEFTKSCRDMCMGCRKYVHLTMKHPQSGKDLDEYGCADSYKVLMEIETQRMLYQLGAAVENLRNELIKSNDKTSEAIAESVRQSTVVLGRIAIAMSAPGQMTLTQKREAGDAG